MKQSCPLILLVAIALATLSYGGKQAETAPRSATELGRSPASRASVSTEVSAGSLPLAKPSEVPLDIEEIH